MVYVKHKVDVNIDDVITSNFEEFLDILEYKVGQSRNDRYSIISNMMYSMVGCDPVNDTVTFEVEGEIFEEDEGDFEDENPPAATDIDAEKLLFASHQRTPQEIYGEKLYERTYEKVKWDEVDSYEKAIIDAFMTITNDLYLIGNYYDYHYICYMVINHYIDEGELPELSKFYNRYKYIPIGIFHLVQSVWDSCDFQYGPPDIFDVISDAMDESEIKKVIQDELIGHMTITQEAEIEDLLFI